MTPIERAARALANGERIGSLPEARHYRQARNVISAIRDPTDEMVAASFEFSAWAGEDRMREAGRSAWEAMIDALLRAA